MNNVVITSSQLRVLQYVIHWSTHTHTQSMYYICVNNFCRFENEEAENKEADGKYSFVKHVNAQR